MITISALLHLKRFYAITRTCAQTCGPCPFAMERQVRLPNMTRSCTCWPSPIWPAPICASPCRTLLPNLHYSPIPSLTELTASNLPTNHYAAREYQHSSKPSDAVSSKGAQTLWPQVYQDNSIQARHLPRGTHEAPPPGNPQHAFETDQRYNHQASASSATGGIYVTPISRCTALPPDPFDNASLASDRSIDNGSPDVNIIPDENSTKEGNMFCFSTFADKHTGTLYNNLTGSFPFISFDRKVCYRIVYHYETNAILALPIAYLQDTTIIEGYNKQGMLLQVS